jgi:hypothetical protein
MQRNVKNHLIENKQVAFFNFLIFKINLFYLETIHDSLKIEPTKKSSKDRKRGWHDFFEVQKEIEEQKDNALYFDNNFDTIQNKTFQSK